jgi:4-hydroxy-L-threonine phosphate dehydrogenase PdxA
MNLAGYRFDGHTEIFASQTKAKSVGMMLAAPGNRSLQDTAHL